MSKVIYINDHVKKMARDRQVKPVNKTILNRIYEGIAMLPKLNARRHLDEAMTRHIMRSRLSKPRWNPKEAGFSLIELTVVVAIVSLLSIIAIPYYQTFAKKAQRVEAKTGLSGLFTMMTIYQLENGKGTSSMSDLGFSMKGTPKYSYGFQSHFTDSNVDGNSDGADGTNVGRSAGWPDAITSNISPAFKGKKYKCDEVSLSVITANKADSNQSNAAYCRSIGCANGIDASGNYCNNATDPDKETSLVTGGLALGKSTFTIGAVAFIGDSTEPSTSTNYQGFDAFTINEGRIIGDPTHDGLKVYD